MTKSKYNPRKIAWRILVDYHSKETELAKVIDKNIPNDISSIDRALIYELVFGIVRMKRKLDYFAQPFLKTPFSKQSVEIQNVLRLGFYQIVETSKIPPFAAVDETVKIVKQNLSQNKAGFINAVLRSFLRDPEKVVLPDKDNEPVNYLGTKYSYPGWLVKRWLKSFEFDETEKILIAGNKRPQFSFRVINSNINANDLLKHLDNNEINYSPGKYFPDYLITNDVSILLKSGFFKEGYINVQDESQGLPVYLLNPPEGAEVLDLCSAPGGKTVALADLIGPDGKVYSLDNDFARIGETKMNVKRIGFKNVELIKRDIFKYMPERKFDFILIDVPCSGLGTISSKADLRWTKSENDITMLANLQFRMLETASRFLADNGVLVYSTCTTEPDEIEDVAERFLAENTDFSVEDGNSKLLEPFKTAVGVYRVWPHKHGVGGVGFVRLRKGNVRKD
jgi:16S rRNA (cytosine967-C5)-methyltransferase